MSFLVTRVPGTQWPDAAGPAWHACVNAPTTTTSPLTTAWLYTVWCLQSRLPGPNHCGLQDRLPVNTLGVHLTGVCETRSGNAMDELDSARAVAAAGPATAAGALTPSSPPLASSAVTLATAAVIQRRCLICSPCRWSLTKTPRWPARVTFCEKSSNSGKLLQGGRYLVNPPGWSL